MSQLTIKPTHTCFDDALELMSRWIKESPNTDWHRILRLAHGICEREDGKGEFSHAWVERDGLVYQDGFVEDGRRCTYAVGRREFYREFKARDVTLYTLRELALENLRTGHYGPWKAKYHALTRNSEKRIVEDVQCSSIIRPPPAVLSNGSDHNQPVRKPLPVCGKLLEVDQ